MVDYIMHFVSLSFEAYGPQSASDFAAALPETAKPLADDLIGGATNAWGSFDGFKSGLSGAAAELDDETLQAAYAAGADGRLFGWQAGWTTFYWAWWIAFAQFVGLFLSMPTKGRPSGGGGVWGARSFCFVSVCSEGPLSESGGPPLLCFCHIPTSTGG